MSSAPRAASSVLQVTRVVRFTFQLIRQHWPQLLALSAIVALAALLRTSQEAAYPNANLWDLALALPLAAEIVAATLLTATIVRMVVPDSTGHYVPLIESIQAVIADAPALATIGLFSNVLITLNVFAAILVRDYYPDPQTDQVIRSVIPLAILSLLLLGLALTVLLAVLVPVRAAEQTDLVRTLVRGIELTRGNRSPIFGLAIAVVVLEVVGDSLVYILMGDPIFGDFSEETPNNSVATTVGRTFIATAVSLVEATATAVLYCELRRIKDGPAPRELALEFD